jgi:hypothetical protein
MAIGGRVIAVIGRAVRSQILAVRAALKLLRLRGVVTGSCGGGIWRWWRCRVLRCHAKVGAFLARKTSGPAR